VLVAAYVGVLELSRPHVDGHRLRLDAFFSLLEQKRIHDVRILDEDAYAVGSFQRAPSLPAGVAPADPAAPTPAERPPARYNVPLIRGSQGQILELLLQSRVPVTVDQQVGKRVASTASLLFPGLILVVLFVYLILSYRRGTGLFGLRSGARRLLDDERRVTFADVAGQDAAVTELREVTDFLAHPERYTALGAEVPRGILLYGPPGCGKTLLARALAGEAGAAFFSISGSDFVELYVGVGASRVRNLFAEARQHAPAVIFIDELDSVGRTRAAAGAAMAQGEQEQALNQVLAEMDGFSGSHGILVVAATNRPDVLDPALLRPGRFDRAVGLERPDERARLAILALHGSRRRLGDDVDLSEVARRAIGLTGADLANVANEGALLAARAGRDAVSAADLDAALDRVLETPERQRRLSLRERSVGRRYAAGEKVTFADVAGADDALAELAELRDHLADPARTARLGGRAPRGILLSGPPGCGKTLIARAVAGEANAGFFSVAASEFVEVFVGEGASRVRELFAEARSMAPAIVFIDEIDAVGGRRSGFGQREHDQTLNQILVELDGFEATVGVLVMAATNRLDMLDPALVRPGRFDRRVTVTLPDRAGRRAILALHARGKPLARDVDLDAVAGLTAGLSGADLANVLNEAALLAARRDLEAVPMALVEEGIDRAAMGVTSRSVRIADEDRRVVAYHEAGHGLVTVKLPGMTAPHRLTIVPRGDTLGRCTGVATDRVLHSRSMFVDLMTVLMAGRAAETLVCGEVTSGSVGDLEQATDIARRMVCELGMSDAVGPVSRSDAGGTSRSVGHSEESARVVDAEIRRLLEEAERRAGDLLRPARAELDAAAAALLERETLTADELAVLVASAASAVGPVAASPSPVPIPAAPRA